MLEEIVEREREREFLYIVLNEWIIHTNPLYIEEDQKWIIYIRKQHKKKSNVSIRIYSVSIKKISEYILNIYKIYPKDILTHLNLDLNPWSFYFIS